MDGWGLSPDCASVAVGWGIPKRHIEPWRDTGVAIEGPAVADLDRAFAETWAAAGAELPSAGFSNKTHACRRYGGGSRGGESTTTAQLYRLDQLIAGGARRSLWLTDAYFVGHDALRPGPQIGRDGRCGCAAPGPGSQ